jgi:hypothetical protein
MSTPARGQRLGVDMFTFRGFNNAPITPANGLLNPWNAYYLSARRNSLWGYIKKRQRGWFSTRGSAKHNVFEGPFASQREAARSLRIVFGE